MKCGKKRKNADGIREPGFGHQGRQEAEGNEGKFCRITATKVISRGPKDGKGIRHVVEYVD